MSRSSNLRNGKAYRIALSSVLATLALICSYIESLIPFNFGIPGIKLGLPNLVILVALYCIGAGYAFTVNIIRIVLSGLLFGGVSAMMYSLAGGILSFAVMYLLIKTDLFSPVGIGMAGGVMHNVGQVTLAALITETLKLYFYLPVLSVTGLVTGSILGFAAALIIRRIR
jgi:heptaprenyl diphosphate synthase